MASNSSRRAFIDDLQSGGSGGDSYGSGRRDQDTFGSSTRRDEDTYAATSGGAQGGSGGYGGGTSGGLGSDDRYGGSGATGGQSFGVCLIKRSPSPDKH